MIHSLISISNANTFSVGKEKKKAGERVKKERVLAEEGKREKMEKININLPTP